MVGCFVGGFEVIYKYVLWEERFFGVVIGVLFFYCLVFGRWILLVGGLGVDLGGGWEGVVVLVYRLDWEGVF